MEEATKDWTMEQSPTGEPIHGGSTGSWRLTGGSKTQLLLYIFPSSNLCADGSVTCLYETKFKKRRGGIPFFGIMFKFREAFRFKQSFFGLPVV